MEMRARQALRSATPWIVAVSLTLSGTTALAVDGVLEINQSCAAVGCFPGDGPGFPVTIVQRGSYRLTSNLDVRGEANPEDVTAIEIGVAVDQGTTLDLNGFRILGPTFCSGGSPPTSCAPTGTGVGIQTNENVVTVRNGRIMGMGDMGVHLVSGARVEDLYVESCGGDGVVVAGSGGVLAGNVARRNGGSGFTIGSQSLVRDNLAQANAVDGLVLGANSGWVGNVLIDNGGSDKSGSAGIQLGGNQCGIATCP